MGNSVSTEKDLVSRVIENDRSGKRSINRLLGCSENKISVGPRGDCILVKNFMANKERLPVLFVLDGCQKHIDDITCSASDNLLLKDSLKIKSCYFSNGFCNRTPFSRNLSIRDVSRDRFFVVQLVKI